MPLLVPGGCGRLVVSFSVHLDLSGDTVLIIIINIPYNRP